MTVDQLSEVARLELNLDRAPWLSMTRPQRDDIDRLARLCRMEPATLLGLEDGHSCGCGSTFLYCHACLFLNPLDVTAPYWRAPWMRKENLPCARHADSHDCITASVLRRSRNMAKLLGFISRRRAALTQRLAWWGR